MKAVRSVEVGRPAEIVDVPKPAPGPGEVLVNTTLAEVWDVRRLGPRRNEGNGVVAVARSGQGWPGAQPEGSVTVAGRPLFFSVPPERAFVSEGRRKRSLS